MACSSRPEFVRWIVVIVGLTWALLSRRFQIIYVRVLRRHLCCHKNRGIAGLSFPSRAIPLLTFALLLSLCCRIQSYHLLR